MLQVALQAVWINPASEPQRHTDSEVLGPLNLIPRKVIFFQYNIVQYNTIRYNINHEIILFNTI